MLLSKSCEYGIRASICLVSLMGEGYVSIREISERMDISFHYLTKIFQKLTMAGLMISFRGPHGGIALAQEAGHIKLLDIVLAIDGPGIFEQCVLGLPGCGDGIPCPMHAYWGVQRERIREILASMSLEDVVNDLKAFNYRLKSGGKKDLEREP